MTTVEILEKAKKLVEKGWGQGNGTNDWPMDLAEGSVCADTAIHRAAGHFGSSHAQVALRRALGIPGSDFEHGCKLFYAWHDAPGRTQAEVVAAFTKAIELAKAQP